MSLQTLTDWGNHVTTQPNVNVDDFTVPEKILLAAENLEKHGQSPFTAEMEASSSLPGKDFPTPSA